MRAIAADDAMVPEDEQIAKSRDRIRLDLRDGVFVDEPRRGVLRLEQPLEFDVVEADQIEVVILFVQNRQFDAKHFFVPTGAGNGELVVCDDERAPLCRRQMTEHDHGDFFHAEFLGGQQTRMARDDIVVGADQDWICPAQLRIEAAMLATCSRLWVRGLLARGISRSIGQRSIWMSMFGPAVERAVVFLATLGARAI